MTYQATSEMLTKRKIITSRFPDNILLWYALKNGLISFPVELEFQPWTAGLDMLQNGEASAVFTSVSQAREKNADLIAKDRRLVKKLLEDQYLIGFDDGLNQSAGQEVSGCSLNQIPYFHKRLLFSTGIVSFGSFYILTQQDSKLNSFNHFIESSTDPLGAFFGQFRDHSIVCSSYEMLQMLNAVANSNEFDQKFAMARSTAQLEAVEREKKAFWNFYDGTGKYEAFSGGVTARLVGKHMSMRELISTKDLLAARKRSIYRSDHFSDEHLHEVLVFCHGEEDMDLAYALECACFTASREINDRGQASKEFIDLINQHVIEDFYEGTDHKDKQENLSDEDDFHLIWNEWENFRTGREGLFPHAPKRRY